VGTFYWATGLQTFVGYLYIRLKTETCFNSGYPMGYPWAGQNTRAHTRLGSGWVRVRPAGEKSCPCPSPSGRVPGGTHYSYPNCHPYLSMGSILVMNTCHELNGKLFLRQDGKSIVLNPDPLTRDQEQMLRSCFTTSKVYNRSTPSMGSIIAMNTCHERNGNCFYAKYLLQILA
jgi:hypothetical protein